LRILVESKYAKKVLKTLGLENVHITRVGGKSDVVQKVDACEADAGLIDADPEPNQSHPTILNRFQTVTDLNPELEERQKEGKKLLVVSPNLREWIAHTLTRRYGKTPDDFQLPSDPNTLKDKMKKPRYRRALCRCAEWLLQQDPPELQRLKDCLRQSTS